MEVNTDILPIKKEIRSVEDASHSRVTGVFTCICCLAAAENLLSQRQRALVARGPRFQRRAARSRNLPSVWVIQSPEGATPHNCEARKGVVHQMQVLDIYT